jgi:biopolymer transport protein TolQ
MTIALNLLGTSAVRLDPLDLFIQADIVVQAVMIGLILTSVWVWTIIVSFSVRMRRLERLSSDFEQSFWTAEDFDSIANSQEKKDLPSVKVALSGISEWKRTLSRKPVNRDGLMARLNNVMESQVVLETDQLSSRLGFLATTGSVAPFVGLFGTVWGIMNSFFQIGIQESSSLAVVAPGIAEALFATAIGLFTAIPAVIAYNRFSDRVNRYEARLQRFADRFQVSLSHELDKV